MDCISHHLDPPILVFVVSTEISSYCKNTKHPPSRLKRKWYGAIEIIPSTKSLLCLKIHFLLFFFFFFYVLVLVLKGKIREVGEKILASNGKKVDFASALASCEDARGTLATPMNEEENKAILGIVKKYNQYAYLGIKEGEDSGQFKYLDGMPVNYTKWHQNEPNGKKTEKCVEMYTDGSWNDKKCNLHRLTICEF
uniref:C-type lectin domain-containing protein n=1 Tax=Amazona collaria TaxID=241587 RepID=A0A8B9FHD7_9PSIT